MLPIEGKAAKRKAKEKVNDPVLDLMTKELSVLSIMNGEENYLFKQYGRV